MRDADTGEQPAQRAVLPLDRQNAYRARLRKMRPGWQPSGDQLDVLLQSRLRRDSRVLDLGCGRGGAVELVWRDVGLAVGVDPDTSSLAGHRAAGMPVIRGVGERLPFIDGSFDVIVCVWVMEHLADPAATLGEVRRVLRPGAHFLFLTPNLRHPLMLANRLGKALPRLQRRLVPRLYGRLEGDTFPVQYRANTPKAINRLAADAGLRVVELRFIPDPTYLAWGEIMFRAAVLADGLLPASRGIHLLGDLVPVEK
ncbi:MAG: class I SAM-dependent methyltransferase [Candidatus Dormibacterales bacterium]